MIDLGQHRVNSHSQYGEDGIIARILAEWGMPVDLDLYWCMDVGAWDGVRFSNIHALVESGAAAYEIEADHTRFAALKTTAERWRRIEPVKAEVTPHNFPFRMELAVEWARPLTPLVLNVDIDGDHAALLEALPDNPFPIVVAEWNDRGDTAQYDPLRSWAENAGYVCVAKTNANLVFVEQARAGAFTEVARCKDVSLWRLARSGSTMLWRCLEAAGCRVDQGGNGAHTVFVPRHPPVILTVRDFRDVALSHARVRITDGDESILGGLRATKGRIAKLDTMAEQNPDAILWRYEDHWNDPAEVVYFLTRTVGIPMDMATMRRIADIVSPDKATALAESVTVKTPERPFLSYDRASHIHHAHLGQTKGKPESWRHASGPIRRLLNHELRDELERWGYSPE